MTTSKRLRHKLARELDLARLRLRHGRTLRPIANAQGPVALVVSLTEFIFQLKLEAMTAKALELEGYRPAFLVQTGSKTAVRYLRAFGMRTFLSLGDYVDDALEKSAARQAASLLEGCRSTRDLAELVFRGAYVGRYVLSTVSRARHEGAVDFDDADTNALVRSTLLVAVRATLAAERLLDQVQPELVLFNERNYAAEAPLSDLALERGLNVVQFVAASQDDAFVFKRYTVETRRLHPRSLSEESWEQAKRMDWTPSMSGDLDAELRRRYDGSQMLTSRNQEWTRPYGPSEVRGRLGLDESRRAVVIFSHVLWDANMFFGEDLFDDQEQWLVETVRAACANDRVDWIVKLHPANVWKRRRDGAEGELGDLRAIREAVGPLPQHVKLMPHDSPISTRSLFDVTDVGVTIRGSVGWELPCLGVPVLTAGTGFYSGRGFTVDSASREEYLERLRHVERLPRLSPEEIELARRHAYALLLRRPLAFSSFHATVAPLQKMGHPLDHNVEIRVRSKKELVQAEDLRRLGAWARRADELDYLAPAGDGYQAD